MKLWGDDGGAVQTYEKVVQIQRDVLDTDSVHFASTLHTLGSLYWSNGCTDKAQTSLSEALDRFRRCGIPDTDLRVIGTLRSLDEMNQEFRRFEVGKGKKVQAINNGAVALRRIEVYESRSKDESDLDDTVSQITFRDYDNIAYDRPRKHDHGANWLTKALDKIGEVTEEFFSGPSPVANATHISHSVPSVADNHIGAQRLAIEQPTAPDSSGIMHVPSSGLDNLSAFDDFSFESPSFPSSPVHHSGVKKNVRQSPEKYLTKTTTMSLLEPDMDDLLAQMNVVTCDMEDENAALPFKEVVKDMKSVSDSSSPPSRPPLKMTSRRGSSEEKRLSEEKGNLGPNDPKMVDIIVRLADLAAESKDSKKAIKLYREAMKMQKKYSGNREEIALICIKLGDFYASTDTFDKAMQYYIKARDINVSLYDENHPTVVSILTSMGLLELKRNEFGVALDYLQQALKIQHAHVGPNQHSPDISQTLSHIGTVYYKERNSLTETRSSDDRYKDFIESGMLGKIAFAHGERGQYLIAMQFYEEELQIMRSKACRNSSLLQRMAVILNCLGQLSIKTGRYSEARDYQRQRLL